MCRYICTDTHGRVETDSGLPVTGFQVVVSSRESVKTGSRARPHLLSVQKDLSEQQVCSGQGRREVTLS